MVEQRPFHSLRITGLHLVTLVSLMPLLIPALAAPGAAWAALLASGMGALVSFQLLYRWQMPHTVAHPYVMILLTIGSYLLSLLLPMSWPWRLLLGMLLYLIVAWRSGLIAHDDWQLVRKVLLNRGDSSSDHDSDNDGG